MCSVQMCVYVVLNVSIVAVVAVMFMKIVPFCWNEISWDVFNSRKWEIQWKIIDVWFILNLKM